MKPKTRKRQLGRQLATAGVATVAALLIGELLVRLLLDVPATPFLREWDPDLGVRYKKNLSTKITRPEFSVTFSTNSRGFREPEPPPPLDGSVLFIGDSYTEGWGVNDGEDYPSLVRQELDERYGSGSIPVVNAAMSASGQSRWLKLLRSDLRDCHPRLVVFQVCWNDCLDNLHEKQFRVLRAQLTSVGTKIDIVEKADRPKPTLRRIQPLLELGTVSTADS